MFALSEIEMSATMSDGATLRDHLESVRRQTGQTPDRLATAESSECPHAIRYLWETWCSSSARRQFNDGLPKAISNVELKAHLDLHGLSMTPFEIGVIGKLEQAYLKQVVKGAMQKGKTLNG